jgi:hypothetical protein
MTRKKLPSILDAAIDVDHQSTLVLTAFSEYLEANPTRSIVLSHPDKGRLSWRVQLLDSREAHGSNLRDASAQIATVLTLEAE